MKGGLQYRQALTKAMAFCSQSEKCRFDVTAKLKQWELSDEEITLALNYLIEERFLDEVRFVRFYVNDKLRFNKWGKIKLTYMLRQKQIPEELIKSELNQIDDDIYQKTLLDLLKTKLKSVKGESDYERTGKLAVFAQGHGFEAELAYKLASQIIDNEE